MEDLRKHHKKNNTKTLNIGAGSLGIGGIVLIGGALVTATIVAFKTRSQRRSSSENTNNIVGAPNKLELMMKDKKDFSADSLPLEVQSPSDEVTSMEEVQTKSILSLTLTMDEKHDCVHSGDSNEGVIVSVAGHDHETALIQVDSDSKSEELGDDCGKIDLESEEKVVMAAKMEEDSCLEIYDGNEEPNHFMLNDNENDEHVEANSLVLIEEHEAVEAPLKDIVSEASENKDEVEDHQETLFTNEAAAVIEGACVNQEVVIHDSLQVQFLEKIEKDRTCSEEVIMENCEVVIQERPIDAAGLHRIEVIGEEVIKAACVTMVNKEDILEMGVCEDAHDMQVCATFAVAPVDDQSTAKEDSPLSQLMSKEEKDEEQVILEDEIFKEGEKDQLNEAAKVDDETNNPPRELMNKEEGTGAHDKRIEMYTEDELVEKDEIPHVKSVKEPEDNEEDVAVKAKLSSDELEDSFAQEEPTPEAKIIDHKIVENDTILGKDTSMEEKQAFASEPWSLKVMVLSILIPLWCLCHWYSELPFPELSLVGSLLFILILLGYKNRATYLVKI